jgi:hypothetical protein
MQVYASPVGPWEDRSGLSVLQPNDAVRPRGRYGDKAKPSAFNGLAALLRRTRH